MAKDTKASAKQSGPKLLATREMLTSIVCWRMTGARKNAGSRVAAILFDSWFRRVDGIEIMLNGSPLRLGFVFPGAVAGPATIFVSEVYNGVLTSSVQVVDLA